MPSYPSNLVAPVASGFNLRPKSALQDMKTELGNTRRRAVVSSNVYVINASFEFPSKAEMENFQKWFKYETNYGNLWFNATWFVDLGFTGKIFRFVKGLQISAYGYKYEIKATILMGPKADNIVVAGVYKEIGMGGPYIDLDFPFGFEQFQGVNLDYKRVSFISFNNASLATMDFNETNWTEVPTRKAMAGPFAIASMTPTRVAVIDNVGAASTVLRMYEKTGSTWAQLGSSINIGAFNPQTSSLCRLSDTRVAHVSGSSTFLRAYDWSEGSLTWGLSGASFTITDIVAGLDFPSITALSSTRIAYISNRVFKLRVYQFVAGVWSQVGGDLSIPNNVNSALNVRKISAMTSTKIAYVSDYKDNTNSAHGIIKEYNFNGAIFVAGIELNIDGLFTGADGSIASITDKRVCYCQPTGPATFYTFELTSPTWVKIGNTGTSPNPASGVNTTGVSSYFLPV